MEREETRRSAHYSHPGVTEFRSRNKNKLSSLRSVVLTDGYLMTLLAFILYSDEWWDNWLKINWEGFGRNRCWPNRGATIPEFSMREQRKPRVSMALAPAKFRAEDLPNPSCSAYVGCNDVGKHQSFGGTHCLEIEDIQFYNHLPVNTASNPRREQFS
jgi:hypothetical protein